MKRDTPAPVLSASEIGQFAYCRRAWWLARVAGHTPANEQVLDAGRRSHRRHGQTVGAAGALRRVAYALLALGALAILVGLLMLVLRSPA